MFRLFVLVPILALMTGAASAQTLSYANAVDKLAAACGKDLERHCKTVQLGNGRIQGCLKKNDAKLSASCKATYPEVFTELARRIDAQERAVKVCRGDYERLCKGVVRNRGYTLECLLKAEKRVSKKCNQIITDAGFR